MLQWSWIKRKTKSKEKEREDHQEIKREKDRIVFFCFWLLLCSRPALLLNSKTIKPTNERGKENISSKATNIVLNGLKVKMDRNKENKQQYIAKNKLF